MKFNIRLILFHSLLLALLLNSCCKEKPKIAEEIIGVITVDLNTDKKIIRTAENLAGNMITDAFMEYAHTNGKNPDFSLIGSGGIRFDESIRSDGIYPAGNWTNLMVNELLPFGSTLMLVTITGAELKQIFERSVSNLPAPIGAFQQLSHEISIKVDITKQAQIIDQSQNPAVITTPGERITSIKFGDLEYNSNNQYTLLINDFLANGGDGFITLGNIPNNLKENLGVTEDAVFNQYIRKNSPVSTVLEGRVQFQ
ncbi:MAG: 5'-nucleotidase C-terminal domain-containing protein [Crocinitomicaceae bacterium]|nr:5'-nucleotidase C-terminal domain-containing protein [Crocinitomicaceae bacterium]